MELITAKEFLEHKLEGSEKIEFYHKLTESLDKIQKQFSPFITMNSSTVHQQGNLKGLPISIKDCICTAGMRTTAGSKILDNYIPPFDATVVAKLKHSGGLIIGKTAQDEFGFGTFSTNCAYEVPKNPHDINRSCGGSSGGAGCITAAANFPHIAIAESTGGSITAPAAFTGTVGITPTYGRVSRYGLIDYSNSMDKIGVIAKTVYDAALGLSYISGHDTMDSTSAKIDVQSFHTQLDSSIKGMRIGIVDNYFEDIEENVSNMVMKGVEILEKNGAVIKHVRLNLTELALPSYYIIAMSEASTNLAKYSGLRYGEQQEISGNFSDYASKIREVAFGDEAKRRIILGTYVRAAGFRDAYYMKALKIRRMIIDEFKKEFKNFDALVAPSMPTIAPRFDQIKKLTPVENYNMDKLTIGPNMSGIPTISIPIGKMNDMPLGLQLIGDHFQESKILRLAYAIERNKNEH